MVNISVQVLVQEELRTIYAGSTILKENTRRSVWLLDVITLRQTVITRFLYN